MPEVPAREPPGRGEEGRDLPGERPAHNGGGGQRQEHEQDQEAGDQQAVVSDVLRERGRGPQDRELQGRTPRLAEHHHAPAVLIAAHLDVGGLLSGRQLDTGCAVHRGGERAAAPEHRRVELREPLDPVRERGRLGYRDRQHSRRAPATGHELRSAPGHGRFAPCHRQAPSRRQPQLDRNHRISNELPHPALSRTCTARHDRSLQARIRRHSPQGEPRSRRGVAMNGDGGPCGGADAGVGLARLGARGEGEEDDAECDHRHDHDEREEQPKTTPKAHAARTPRRQPTAQIRLLGRLQRRYHESATGL